MKFEKKLILLLLFIFLVGTSAFSQEFKQPSEGKVLVYFVRFSGIGALINFKYFNGEKYLGKMSGVNYFTYECDPGEHIFWAAAENRNFAKGDSKANATYIIEVLPTMGAFKAAVRLHPVAPDNIKALSKVKKILSKRSESYLVDQEKDMAFFIKTGMQRYQKVANDAKIITSNRTF